LDGRLHLNGGVKEKAMRVGVETLKEAAGKLVASPKVRIRTISVLAVVFVLQLYFVRELLAAEVLFGIGFVSLLLLGGVVYALGAIGERGFDLAEVGVRILAVRARRGYAALEEVSRKALRPTRSESAH
jgi:hypothetical protein